MQMHCREPKREEYKQLTPLAAYLVSLIQLYFTSFAYSYSLVQLFKTWQYPHCPDFLYKWSWGFCVMQMHCREHKREEYKQLTPLSKYLVSLNQLYFTSLYILTFLYKTWLYHTVPTFYINGHGASV